MATTDLKLDEPGTLPRPGPIGRLARLVLGALCLMYLYDLVGDREQLWAGDTAILPAILQGHIVGFVIGFWLISYVVNIGFSRSWGKKPALVSAIMFGLIAGVGQYGTGGWASPAMGIAAFLWLVYFFGHLGTAFVLSGALATPGCEMRAFHHLWTMITGIPTKEHYCPVGPLHPLDQWEAKRR
ncbi:MAG: hypothetical protein ACE5EM_06495 [Sphingomonadales bacterium]